MAQLTFEIDNQIIKRTDDFQPVARSQNYLSASFTFSDDWGDEEKHAIFKSGGKAYEIILDENNECTVPWEALRYAGQMYVSAYSGDRVTASVAVVNVLRTGYTEDISSTEEPSVDVYKTLKEKIAELEATLPELIDEAISSASLSDFYNDVGYITMDDLHSEIPVASDEDIIKMLHEIGILSDENTVGTAIVGTAIAY